MNTETLTHPTIQTTWPSLKTMAGEFFRALPTASDEEADSVFKCLTLGYLGLEGSRRDLVQAELLMQIASRKMLERGFTVPSGALRQREFTQQDLNLKRKLVNDAYFIHGFPSAEYDQEFDELHTLTLSFMAQGYRKERGAPPDSRTPYD